MRRSARDLAVGVVAGLARFVVVVVALLSVACGDHKERGPDPDEGIADRTSPGPFGNRHSRSAVDAILQKLEWGRIVFDVPATMRYEEAQVGELLLSATASVPDLQAQLEASADAQSARIRISSRMEARLTGIGFAIERIEPGVQAVSRQVPTRWRWEIVPTEHGTRVLHLALYAHVEVGGSDTPYVLRTFDKAIEVDITIAQRMSGFVRKNWQWLWAAVLAPVAGYLWRVRRRRKGSPVRAGPRRSRRSRRPSTARAPGPPG